MAQSPWMNLVPQVDPMAQMDPSMMGRGPLTDSLPPSPPPMPQRAPVQRAPQNIAMMEQAPRPPTLMDLIQESAGRREMDAQLLRKEAEEQKPQGLNDVNLKPLIALTDSWNNTNLAQSYNDPTIKAEAIRQKLMERAAKAEEAASADRLALMKSQYDEQYKDRRMDNLEALTAITAASKDRALDIAEKKGGSAPKLPGEAWKAAGFAQRLKQAEQAMSELNAGGYFQPSRMDQLKAWGPRELESPKHQKLQQLKRNWVNATLRPESGASISESEFQNADLQYFPQPGDTQEVIAQKAANRAQTEQALRAQGGAAYGMIPQMGTGGQQMAQMQANMVRVQAPDGSIRSIPAAMLQQAIAKGGKQVP